MEAKDLQNFFEQPSYIINMYGKRLINFRVKLYEKKYKEYHLTNTKR